MVIRSQIPKGWKHKTWIWVCTFRVRTLSVRCLGKHTITAESQRYINAHVVAYDPVGCQRAGSYVLTAFGRRLLLFVVSAHKAVQQGCWFRRGVFTDAELAEVHFIFGPTEGAVNSPTLAHEKAHCRDRPRFCSAALLPIVAHDLTCSRQSQRGLNRVWSWRVQSGSRDLGLLSEFPTDLLGLVWPGSMCPHPKFWRDYSPLCEKNGEIEAWQCNHYVSRM